MVVYKQSFSCKINCTRVKYTAKKLYKSPGKTDKARSRSLLQMRASDSGPKPGLWGIPTPTPTPHPWHTDKHRFNQYRTCIPYLAHLAIKTGS